MIDDLSAEARIRRTVFIKAHRSIAYVEVVKVMDGMKGAGPSRSGYR